MGLNGQGVVAVVLNRRGSLGPEPGKRSRGELPLLALQNRSAEAATSAIVALDAGAWRSFNLVVADSTGAAFWVKGLGHGRPEAKPFADGVHVITSSDPNDMTRERVVRYLPRFRSAGPPELDDYAAWRALITDQSGTVEDQLHVVPRHGYGTVCSSILGLATRGPPVWLFTASSDAASFEGVDLSASARQR